MSTSAAAVAGHAAGNKKRRSSVTQAHRRGSCTDDGAQQGGAKQGGAQYGLQQQQSSLERSLDGRKVRPSVLRRMMTAGSFSGTKPGPSSAGDIPAPSFQVPTGGVTSFVDTVVEGSYRKKIPLATSPYALETSRWHRLEVCWVIDPRVSKLLGPWDLLCVIALLFVALVTPFEVAFLESPRSAADIGQRFSSVGWLWCVNRLVDVIFTIDLVLQFRLMYKTSDVMQGTRWVTDPGEIIRHYLFGWFLLDALSIAVAAFDILPVANAEGTDGLQSLRSLRMMRILRLIKLVRLLRASRLFQRWETQIAINYSQLSLWSSLIKVCLISHWFACIWGIQVALAERNVGTWVDSFNYCTPVSNFPPNATVRGSPISRYSADDCVPDGPWALYSASAYWAVMTITSIGYGDIHATDNNISEQVLNTLLMLTGAMLWGHVIGTFCGIVATMNPHHAEFNRRMDDLNSYLALNNLPQELRRRLREYLHQTRHLQMASASKEIVTLLSPALQGEVTWAVNKRWLMRVSFFNKAEPEFLVQISLCLSPLVFTPGELAVSGYLYIVHRGIALYGGRVLTSGRVWGEDCIIQSAHLQKKWCARAMNYLEVYMISRDDVLEVAQSFPTTWHIIRKQAVRMAVRRQFILAAKLIAGQKGMSWGGSTSTFDRILDQACSVPIAELRLQGALTSNRVETGPNAPILEPRSRRESAEEGGGRDLGTGTAPWQPLDESECTSRSMASTTTCSKACVRIADLRIEVDGAREVGEMGMDRMPQGGILKAAGLELAPGTALVPRPKPILTNYGAKPPAMKRQNSNLPPVTNFAGYMEASPRLSGKSSDGAGGSAHPLLSGSMSGSERWSSRSTTCATSNNLRRSVSHNDVCADAPVRSEINQVAHLLKAAQLTAASTTPSPGSRSFINRTSQSLAGGKGQSFLKSSSSAGGGGRAYNAPGEDLVRLGEELRSDVSQALAETRDELGTKIDAMSSQINALQRDMHQLLAIMSSQNADAPSSDVDLSFISGARRVS